LASLLELILHSGSSRKCTMEWMKFKLLNHKLK
jgi:hypothetical protein